MKSVESHCSRSGTINSKCSGEILDPVSILHLKGWSSIFPQITLLLVNVFQKALNVFQPEVNG